jgi:hypothetical protein
MSPCAPAAAAGTTLTLRSPLRLMFNIRHSRAAGLGSTDMSRPFATCGAAHSRKMPILPPMSITVSSGRSSNPGRRYVFRLNTSQRSPLAMVSMDAEVR